MGRGLISDQKNILLLHKDEWRRLKSKAGPPESPLNDEKQQYLNKLQETSQKWLKSWPDTTQGHVVQLANKRKQQRAEHRALIKSFKNTKIKDGAKESIREARQLIFENSCYGNQLKSALLQSKALEENDAQLLFKSELKRKSLEMANIPSIEYCSFDLDKNYEKDVLSKQLLAKELAQFNKTLHQTNEDKILKKKAKEVENRSEEAKANEEMHKIENEEKKFKNIEKKIHECHAEQMRFRIERTKREERDQEAADRYKIQQQQLRAKIQNVYRELYHGKANSSVFKNHYNLLENIKQEEQKKYEQFIESGIKKYVEKERNELEKGKKIENKAAQVNSTETAKHSTQNEPNKDPCAHRQCILTKCGKTPRRKGPEGEYKTSSLGRNVMKTTCSVFAENRNTLTEELRKREKIPSPWTGASAAHAQFARYADDVLKLCQYKGPARKVVDDYIKLNGLNSAELPVPNYQDS